MGFAISRMPDISNDSAAIVRARYAISEIHETGGFGVIPEMRLSTQCWSPQPAGFGDACADDAPSCGLCYATSPYGIYEECDQWRSNSQANGV